MAQAHSESELMLNDTKWNPDDRASLGGRLDSYSCAFSGLKQAAKAFKANKYSEVNNWAVYTRTYTQECEDGFKGRVSPLTKENHQVVQLCNVILDINVLFSWFISYFLHRSSTCLFIIEKNVQIV